VITPSTFSDPLASMNSYLVVSGYFQHSAVNIAPPSVELLTNTRYPEDILRFLEHVTRTADKSEIAAGPHSHRDLLAHILSQNPEYELEHASGLEHLSLTFRIRASHDVTQELARQRSAAHTQASTRHISYTDRMAEAILPWHLLNHTAPEMAEHWVKGMESAFANYREALERFGWQPQEARGFLPNDAKTEIVTTMNIRDLRSFLRLRTRSEAHPDMQVVAREILRILMLKLPILFQDIEDQVYASVAEPDHWMERAQGEYAARDPRTYGQWRPTLPQTPRPGEVNTQLAPDAELWVPYADIKNRPDLMEEWSFKLLSRVVSK